MLKQSLFSFIFLLLFLPALQKWFQIVPVAKLWGDYIEPKRPHFNKKDWGEGKFQEQYSAFLEQKSGFHNTLIRLNNQFDYFFFAKANANDCVIGKDNYILGEGYIRAYLGNDFIGDVAIDKKLRRLKFLQELLKKKGKDLILVFEPGKASFFPEKIPDEYKTRYPKKKSNYEAYLERAKSLGIKYYDFNHWFKLMKDTVPYPLYPKNGIHWSTYGAYLAADSIIRIVENLRKLDLPELVLDSIRMSSNLNQADYDAERTLNLWTRMETPPMAYPVYHYVDKPDHSKVKVLTVGDSYYWNIYNMDMPSKVFSNKAYWYFNSFVYPENLTNDKLRTDSLDIIKEVEKNDVIFLMITECWLTKFDFDFTDKLFDLYTPELEPDYPYLYEGKIRKFTDWFNLVAQKAIRNRQRLDQTLHNDAVYTFRNELKEKFLLRFGPLYFKYSIESDKQWFALEKIKAKKQNTDLNTIIIRDCWYLFNKDCPELCRQFTASLFITQELKNDPVAMKKIINNPWYLRPEEMLWQVAIAKAKGNNQSLALMTW